MINFEKIVNILACPICKTVVTYDYNNNELNCRNCGSKYVIEKSVPVMLNREDQVGIDFDINTENGKNMKMEFTHRGIYYKLLSLGKKIINCDLISSNLLKNRRDDLMGREMILEVGAGNRRLSEKVINLDIDLFPNTDVIGDAHKLPFIDNSFDVLWIEVVLEHVRNPQQVVSEIYRVLKPGGYVFSVVPFVHPYHGYPGDYNRYSLEGMEELFSKFKKEDSGIYRGPSVALVNILTDYLPLFSFSKNKKINLFLKALAMIFLFPIKYLDLILVRNSESHKLAHTLYYLGQK